MKILWFVLLLAALTTAVSLAQRGREGWRETEDIKCCIKSVARDTPPECREMGRLLCQQSGGKPVNHCSECK